MAPGIRDMQLTSISGQKYSRLNAEDEPRDLEAAPLLLSASSSDGEGERNLENRKGLEKLEVKVIGMTCAACSNSVENSLLNLAGVYTASVALLQNKADVSYDPSKVKVSAYPFHGFHVLAPLFSFFFCLFLHGQREFSVRVLLLRDS